MENDNERRDGSQEQEERGGRRKNRKRKKQKERKHSKAGAGSSLVSKISITRSACEDSTASPQKTKCRLEMWWAGRELSFK